MSENRRRPVNSRTFLERIVMWRLVAVRTRVSVSARAHGYASTPAHGDASARAHGDTSPRAGAERDPELTSRRRDLREVNADVGWFLQQVRR